MSNNLPFVSIIMPIRNEEEFISKSLISILNQNYPSNLMEIIVVDGRSTDKTKEIVLKFIEETKTHKILLLDNPFKIVPFALNIGIKCAKGDIIIRVDGHCEIQPDYIKRCVECLKKTGADCVGGVIEAIGMTYLAKAIGLAQSSVFGVGDSIFRIGTKKGKYVATLAFGAYLRDIFERIGYFDEELVCNQDDEFNYRLIQAGGKIYLEPSIKTIYYCRTNLKDLAKQYFRYGFWKVRVFQKRGKIISYRHIVPSIFVLGLLVSVILSIVMRTTLYFFIVFIPYLITNLFFSILANYKDISTLFLLPFCYFTIHFSYGLGFLFGLWKFRRYGFGFFKLNKRKRYNERGI